MNRTFKFLGKVFTLYMAVAYIVIAIICLAIIAFMAADSYYNYFTYSKLGQDVSGAIVVSDGLGNILYLTIADGHIKKKKLIVKKGYTGFGCPCLYKGNTSILLEATNDFAFKSNLYSYNIADNKIDKVLTLKSNISMPSVSNNNLMYAVYSSSNNDWDDINGFYDIYKFRCDTPEISIHVTSMPSRISWCPNDSVVYFPLYVEKKTYIAKYYLYQGRMDTLIRGDNPALSHDGKRIAYIEQNKIKTCDTLGQNIKEIVGGHLFVKPFEGTSIAWSPNNKYLIFCGVTIAGRLIPTVNIYLVPVAKKNNLTPICYSVMSDLDWK